MRKNKNKSKYKYELVLFTKIFVGIILILLLSLVFVDFYYKALKPTYLSYASSCKENGMEYAKSQGYVLGGSFSINITNNITTTNITTYNKDPYVLAHEKCHENQYKEHRLYNCIFPPGVLYNEFECYFKQYFRIN